ncbi:MAG: cell wall hydrolase, partial [Macromonas sp.]
LKRKDFHCLARNIYHEAQGEPVVGKLAVAQITLNRLQAGLWGSSVCKVVYAPAQFSWTDQPRKRHAKPQGPEWEESVQVAKDFLGGQRVRRLEASTHFHSQSIRAPGWTRQMRVAQQVGQHIFFNDKSVELKNS